MSKTPISALQEFLQKRCYPLPKYDEVKKASGTCSFTYRVGCEILGRPFSATGESNSKQTAKHLAAENLIMHLKKNNINVPYEPENNNNESSENRSPLSSVNGVNYIGRLQEHCVMHKYVMPCYSEGGHSVGHSDFQMTCKLGTYLVEGTSNGKKKQAKYACAKKMLEDLEKMSEAQKLQYKIRDSAVQVTPPKSGTDQTDKSTTKELSLDSPAKTSDVINRALSLFPKLTKAHTATADSAKVKLSMYHTYFKSSLDSSQLVKFFEYYKNLNLHQIQNDMSKLSSALNEICAILNITKKEHTVKTSDNSNYGVVIKLTTNPEFSDVAVADNLYDARLNVYYRIIRTIFYLLL